MQLSSQTFPRGNRQGEILGPMCHDYQQAEVKNFMQVICFGSRAHDLSLFLPHFHKGGGFSLDQLAIIYVVIVCHLREGGKPNLLHDVPKSADFFKGPDPLFCKSLFNSIIFNYKCILFFSGSMLRINAEPSFFTEIFTELKSVGAHTEFRT